MINSLTFKKVEGLLNECSSLCAKEGWDFYGAVFSDRTNIILRCPMVGTILILFVNTPRDCVHHRTFKGSWVCMSLRARILERLKLRKRRNLFKMF